MAARLKRKVTANSEIAATPNALAMRFVDFSIRAWREGTYVQVIAHSTPAGAMRFPVATRIGQFDALDYRLGSEESLASGAEVGRSLARFLFPAEVWRLLCESLSRIGSHRELGLRLRLCLDDDLIDLPWEYLYRPDVTAMGKLSGFLLTDGRISLTREPPSVLGLKPPSDVGQTGLFLGTLWDDRTDGWKVQDEYNSLVELMRPIQHFLKFKFRRSNDTAGVNEDLAAGCDVFHYAGHTNIDGGVGKLVQLVSVATLRALGNEFWNDPARTSENLPIEAIAKPAAWSSNEILAERLADCGTRLAVFNACNSGLWPFVRPFMRAGVPAVIGVQGVVTNVAALNFAAKFYQCLAVGLTVDEAMTYARLYLLQPKNSGYPLDWGRFMAYLPTDSATLFPRVEGSEVRERQNHVRKERTVALNRIARKLDGAGVSRTLFEMAQHSVLILGRFTPKCKPILEMIRRELSTPPRPYVPILFDFERAADRTMVENVLRMACVSRFVIADLTDPKWVLAELQQIVPSIRSLPVIPIINAAKDEREVIAHFEGYRSVHKVVRYRNSRHLASILDSQILKVAERLHSKLKPRAVL